MATNGQFYWPPVGSSVAAYGQFGMAANRRLPVGTISAEEKTLANKVRAQRRAFAAGRLCTYQVRRLQCIPGFSFHPLDDKWQASCGAYARFTAQHRDAPKLSSTTPSDRVLARWAAKTRMAYRAGTLPPRRVDAANRLEFWHWGTQPTRPR